MAANKEAIAIVLDIGPSMCVCSDSGSPLQNAKSCIGMILQRKIFSESKDEIALILSGTPQTDNQLAQAIKNEYLNISVQYNLQTASWDLIQYVQNIEGTTITADYVDALVVAMDVLAEQTKHQKFASQRILIFSNFGGEVSNDQIDIIIKGIRNSNMQLNIISPHNFIDDDDSDDDRSTDQIKMVHQLEGKTLIRNILKEVQGESYSFSDALPALTFYQKKAIQPTGWNAMLEISSSFKLPITGYVKISQYKLNKRWDTVYAHDPNVNIMRETSYHMNDEAQTEIKKEDIIDGYRYGTTLIPFSAEDKANMSYKSAEKGIKVLGFTKEDNIKCHHYIGDKVIYIVSQKNNELVEKALSAFIQALYETSMVAVVRYVYSTNSAPKLGFLSPRIKKEYESLVFIQLPFMEDLRHFSFTSLDANAKNLPTDEQSAIIDELITEMDLSIVTSEDGTEEEELFKSSQTINPYLQRYFQCLQHRALKSDNPLPPLPSYIKNILKVPDKVANNAKPILEKIKKLFPFEEVLSAKSIKTGASMFQNGEKTDEPPAKRNRSGSDTLQGGVAEIVMGSVQEVGTVTPLEDFKKLISNQNCNFLEVCKQLENVVLKLLKDPIGGNLHLKAINCLKGYREESLKKLESSGFNNFLKELKSFLSSSHKQVWQQIISEKINLITSKECKKSDISVQDAEQFLMVTENKAPAEEEDEDELLAQM